MAAVISPTGRHCYSLWSPDFVAYICLHSGKEKKQHRLLSDSENASQIKAESSDINSPCFYSIYTVYDAAWLHPWCSDYMKEVQSCSGRCCWSEDGRNTTERNGRRKTGTSTGEALHFATQNITTCCRGSASTTIPRLSASHAR